MTHRFTILALAFLAFAGHCATQPAAADDKAKDKAKDEALIRKLISLSEEAWNKKDAGALAAYQTDDVDHINTSGGWSKGREAIRKLWAQLFETKFKEDTAKNSVEKIRFLKPDVAVVIVRIIHKRPAEETESLATFVMTKDDAKWQIVSYQATRLRTTPKEK